MQMLNRFHKLAQMLIATGLTLPLLSGCGLDLTGASQSRNAVDVGLNDLRSYTRYAQAADRGLGAWLLHDGRLTLGPKMHTQATLPAKVDLRPDCPPVYNQGPFRSCTGFTVAKGLGEFLLRKAGRFEPLSASYHYGAAMQIDLEELGRWDQEGFSSLFNRMLGTYHGWEHAGLATYQDSGASLAVAMGMLKLGGAVAEQDAPYPPASLWKHYWQSPYAPNYYLGAPVPPAAEGLPAYFTPGYLVFHPGELRYNNLQAVIKVSEVKRLRSLHDLKRSLRDGMPVACGVEIYPGFYGAEAGRTGVIPVPDPMRERPLDGHAMLCVGYDDVQEHLIMRNSWGSAWGDRGYAYLPYEAVRRGMVKEAWSARL